MRALLLSSLALLLLAAPCWAQSSWKHQITARDPFVVHGQTGRWVKFTIVQSDPSTVHFQNSRLHAFHYDAVTQGLPGFLGISRADFDAQALHTSGRTLLLGAVLFPKAPENGGGGGWGPGPGIGLPFPGGPGFGAQAPEDFGIQLIGIDPLPPELVKSAFFAVKAAVRTKPGAKAFYMPTPSQRATATHHQIEVSSPARWLESDAVYAPGWALGRLVRLDSDEIDAAYADGRLRAEDVLVTDGVPNDMPRVAGIVTLSPASDNSHVAILAQTWEIPFVFPQPDTIQDELVRLEGKRVLLRVSADEHGPGARVDDLDHLQVPLVERILALKAPRAIGFPAAERRGNPGLDKTRADLWLDTRGLTPADAKFVGGKAAHFGILDAALGDQSPRAIAFTYDLFEAFMSVEHDGAPLRDAVAALMAKHQAIFDAAPQPSYPSDRLSELRSDLAALQDTIRDEVRLPDAIRAHVLAVLADHFPADLRLRFRSSSNLEDGEFSGAGLYRSASSRSPSRRVFRAIRRVYASFYNERAVLERLRHHVDESQVFMGLAVHRTFPDEIELANGVATLVANADGFDLELATQAGAASAVLPDEGATSELVRIGVIGPFYYVELRHSSNLLPLGDHVLAWEDEQAEYKQLAQLLKQVSDRYAAVTGTEFPRLDLEFKKLRENGTERFVVKQVRPLPERSAPSGTAFLVQPAGRPLLTVFQGEQADAYALHRLKCEVKFGLRGSGFELNDQAFAAPFLDDVYFRSAEDGELRVLEGDPASWTGAGYSFEPLTRHARFSWARPGTNPGETTLVLQLPEFSGGRDAPVVLLDEVTVYVEATYRDPVPTVAFGSTHTQKDAARLSPEHTGPLPQSSREKAMNQTAPGGLELKGTIVWPPYPGGIIAGYTAPLLAWKGPFVLEGLLPGTSLLFEDPFSRTYRPDHHNFGRTFAFEPELSDAIPQGVKDQLRALRIRRIYLQSYGPTLTEDFSGQLEPWPRSVGATQPSASPQPAVVPGIGLEDALQPGSK